MSHPWTKRILTAAAVSLVVVAPALPAQAAPPRAAAWAPAGTATIHPGVQMRTRGAQCTANFVFTNGTKVYLGYAAHCASTSAATATNGCQAGSLPLGTPVQITGATRPGRLAYSSWHTMRQRGERNGDACKYNDFALVQIDPADVDRVNPSVPRWGGPDGLNTVGIRSGEIVYSYGNSALRRGIALLNPKPGVSLGTVGNGWSHGVYTATPGIPGDSGSAFLDSRGRALGVLSTLMILPWPASNGVGDLAHQLAYARAYGDLGGVRLVPGTEPFRGR